MKSSKKFLSGNKCVPDFFETFANLIVRRDISEALEELVIFKRIKNVDDFNIDDLKKLLSCYIGGISNEYLRTKILLEYERAEKYIDYNNFNSDKMMRNFYFRKANLIFVLFHDFTKNWNTDDDGLAEILPVRLKDFIHSSFPHYLKYLQNIDIENMKAPKDFEIDLHSSLALILNNVIVGKYKKGMTITKHFKNKNKFLLLTPKHFQLILGYFDNKSYIINDNINSMEFISAFCSLIRFSYYKV